MAKKPQTTDQLTQENPVGGLRPSDDVLNSVIAHQKSAAAACLQIFIKMAQGHVPSGDELTLLYHQGYDNQFAIEREVDLRRNTLRLKALAKTRAIREELRKRVEEAKAAFNAEAPMIEEEMREFVRTKQARVDELSRAITEPQAQLSECEQAVAALKTDNQLPAEVHTTCSALRSRLNEKFMQFIDAKNEAEAMRGRLALANRLSGFVGRSDVALPSDLADLVNGNQMQGEDGQVVSARKLSEYKQLTESRLKAAEVVIARDAEEYESQMAELDKSLEFWLD